jgi:hypothetical protein
MGAETVEKLADHLSALADMSSSNSALTFAWKKIAQTLSWPSSKRRRLRGHQLRQAGRQGTRLRIRPRPGLS